MTDPQEGQPEGNGHTMLSKDEVERLANRAALQAHARHGLVYEDTVEKNRDALAERIFEMSKTAIAFKPGDRDTVTVGRSRMMATIFDDVPGPAEWAEEEHPAVAARTYAILDSDIWRLCNMDPGGAVQLLVDGDLGLVLCRTKMRRTKEEGVYLTKNLTCLREDYSAPARSAVRKAEDKLAARMELAANRIPEHQKAFLAEFRNEVKGGLSRGTDLIQAAIDAGTPEEDLVVDGHDVPEDGDE